MKLQGLIFDMDGTIVDAPYDWPRIRAHLDTKGQPILKYLAGLSEPEKSGTGMLDTSTMSGLDWARDTLNREERMRPAAVAAERLRKVRQSRPTCFSPGSWGRTPSFMINFSLYRDGPIGNRW